MAKLWRLMLGVVVASLCLVVPVLATSPVTVVADATLVDIPLSTVQNAALPSAPITNDRGVLLGGIGSDLYHMPGAPADEFWAVTDRGPNSEVEVDGEVRPTALTPEFTPTIVQVKIAGGVATPIRYIPIVTKSGAPVTGLPNLDGPDPLFWNATATEKLAFNPNGLDVEGMVRTKNGEFWIVDEYRPSLVRVSAKGTVLARYVPSGVSLPGADYPVIDALPAAYAQRKGNRGFEGLTISADEKTIFIVLQSPLSAPDKATGDRTRTTRIMKFDVPTAKVTGEYVYRLEIAAEFNPRPKMKQSEMKLSGVAAIDANRLLVLERTDWAFAVYRIDLTTATNVNASTWSTTNGPVSLEFFADPATVNVVPAEKTLLFHSSSLSGMPGKVEGLTIIDATTLAIANDNDFDVGTIDAQGNNQGEGKKSRVLVLNVPDITK